MRLRVSILTLLALLALSLQGLAQNAPAQGAAPAPGALRSVSFDDTALLTVIKALSQYGGTNYPIDPKLTFGQPGPDGKLVPEPLVTLRLRNVTADDALKFVLAKYNLAFIDDPASGVRRIGPKEMEAETATTPAADKAASAVQPNPPAPPAVLPGGATVTPAVATAANPAALTPAVASNAPVESVTPGQPIIYPNFVDSEMQLTEAISYLCGLAGINYVIDPATGFAASGTNGPAVPQPMVTLPFKNTTAQKALDALLDNYNLTLVDNPKTGIARVTKKPGPNEAPLVTDIIQLQYASPSNMVAAIMASFVQTNRSKVVADIRTSQLVIRATEPEMEAVRDLVQRLDSPTKQVLIEARLLETTMDPSTTKGIDWLGTLGGQHITFGNGVASGTATTTSPGTPVTTTTTTPGGRTVTSTSNPSDSVVSTITSVLGNGGFAWNTASGLTPAMGFLSADGVSAVLSFLNKYSETKLISSPRTVTLDNEPAVIEAGTLFPIVNVTPGSVQVPSGASVSYSNLTVRLEVTPRISAKELIRLSVHPSVLRLGDQVSTSINGQNNTVYAFNERDLKTSVMIPSGNTLVMGGLIEDEIQKNSTKVPLLGDIPGVGALFRTESKTRQKSNLLIFITPTIVQDSDFQPTKTDFLKTAVPAKDEIEGDWSAWDSGEIKHRKKKPQPDPQTGLTNGVPAQPATGRAPNDSQ